MLNDKAGENKREGRTKYYAKDRARKEMMCGTKDFLSCLRDSLARGRQKGVLTFLRYCPCPNKAHDPSSCSNIRALSFSWPCFAFSRFAFYSDCNRGLKGYKQRDASFCDFQGQQPDKGKLLPRRARTSESSGLCTFFCLMAVHWSDTHSVGTELHVSWSNASTRGVAFMLSKSLADRDLGRQSIRPVVAKSASSWVSHRPNPLYTSFVNPFHRFHGAVGSAFA
jgi:hypothetical protein